MNINNNLLNNKITLFFSIDINHIGGLMVAVLVLSAVDRALEHWSGHTKDCKVGGCCSERANTCLRI